MKFPHSPLTTSRFLLGAAVAVFSTDAFAASPAWLTAHDKEIKALVSRMTLEEKVGQMTQPDLKALKDRADIEKLFLGSVLSGGSSDPATGNSVTDWAHLTSEIQSHALKTRLAIPVLYGIDAVHGHNNVLDAVVFPHNIGLGCMRNPALVEKIARVTAEEVRATGIHWAFAPCVAVPNDIRWGRTYEGYSQDPAIVSEMGTALVRGLQGADLTGKTAVLACAKHFVGDGGTTYGSSKAGALLDQGDTRLDETTLRAIHMAGYPDAIAAGVGTIMPSYSSWNGVKCSGSKYLLTDVLKKELGFEGFVISDYNAIDQLMPPAAKDSTVVSNNAAGQVKTSNYKKCIEISINAGMDMVMVTNRYKEFITLLMELAHEGKVPMARIDDAVTRILRVKHAQGLMVENYDPKIDPKLQEAFGSAAHREVAREAVRQSMVLLKNEGGILPLTNVGGRIHVAGRGANNLGMQCGGWTIDWQGKTGEVTPGGTTILSAIRELAGGGTEVTVSPDGSGAAGARVGVVVIGENPYAESKGDRADLSLSTEDAAVVSTMKTAGVPVVLVILSGRPMILGELADQADAIIAAWLPGTEGSGVADVLFGTAAPKGRLSFAWPRSMAQIPLAVEKGSGAVLFPRGFGLDYPTTAR